MFSPKSTPAPTVSVWLAYGEVMSQQKENFHFNHAQCTATYIVLDITSVTSEAEELEVVHNIYR